MKSTSSRASRRNRGSVTVLFTLGILCMIGLVGVCLDFGYVAARKNQLQNYVDAKAVAALKEQFGSPPRIISAEDYLGTLGTGTSAVIGEGAWDFVPRTFTEYPPVYLPASMVPARSATVGTFDVPLFFGPLFGIQSATIHVDAIAFAPKRDVVIVQDVSGSMCPSGGSPPCASGGGIGAAKTADVTLVEEMRDQQMPGDRVGVVAFAGGVVGTPLSLTTLAGGGASTVTSYLNGLAANGSTNIPSGIQAGTALFTGPDVTEVERIMILVGDGVDGHQSQSESDADAAAALGIDVYTIYFCSSSCSASGQSYMGALIRGRGNYSQAPSGAQLTSLLVGIVTNVPMRVVQ
jgi:hypothetical protein